MVDKKRMEAIRGMTPMPENQRHQYDITDLKAGGYLSIRDENHLVTDISRYLDVKWANFARRKKNEWIVELTLYSLKTGETRYVEYYEDDEVEIYETVKEVKLRDISYFGRRLTREDLEEISEEEEGDLIVDGKTFSYDDDETAACLYFRGYMTGDEDRAIDEADHVRLYEFEARDGTCLTVEAWHEDASDDRPDREAFISKELQSSTIVILQLEQEK